MNNLAYSISLQKLLIAYESLNDNRVYAFNEHLKILLNILLVKLVMHISKKL